MRRLRGDFRIRANTDGALTVSEFVNGQHFAINPVRISESLYAALTDAEDDLVRVAMAIYVVDRCIRRSAGASDCSAGRELDIEVSVSNPEIWNSQADSISRILFFLGGDQWRLRFVRGASALPHPSYLFAPATGSPKVCLYSAGLDSFAGLTIRLQETQGPFYAVTARHRSSLPPPLRAQYRHLAARFGHRVAPLVIPTALVNPNRLDQQELSQRCRAFLFCAIAAAVASRVGTNEVEVFENGVGALNVPPMNGMLWGGRATRGCHAHFLRSMSALVSSVLGHNVSYVLPFKWWTKAQMVTEMTTIGLGNAVSGAVSCVHFPRRVSGSAKQCGLCPACIGTQQAVISAGLEISSAGYARNLLDKTIDVLPPDDLADLKQHVLQIADFHQLAFDGSQPQVLRRHLASSQAITATDPAEKWVELLGRYRDEWIAVADKARQRGCRWPKWLDGCRPAASLATAGARHV